MKVVITGGAGFLGVRLTEALLRRGRLGRTDGAESHIDAITLLDMIPPPTWSDARVDAVVGDILDPSIVERVLTPDTDSIFHLAAVVSGMAEADFDAGMRINVDATRLLLERCRRVSADREHAVRFVFTSSVAVYGGAVPGTVSESVAATPRSSYGMEKAVAELLIQDYSRRGFVDGRAIRLPTITVRPGRPNAAASSFASSVIREPLKGEDAICPVPPDTRIWVASPGAAIDALLGAHDLPADLLGLDRILNAPGISVTAREMVAALGRVAGDEVAGRVQWRLDPRVSAIVGSWPSALDATRARALGLRGDTDFETVIRRYLEEQRDLDRI